MNAFGDDEQVLWQGRSSWRSQIDFIGRWGTLALLPLVAAYLVDRGSQSSIWGYASLVSAAGVALVALVAWLVHVSRHYTITDHEVIIRSGLLNRDDDVAELRKITGNELKRSLGERLLGIGTIVLTTADSRNSEFRLVGLASSKQVHKQIRRAMYEVDARSDHH